MKKEKKFKKKYSDIVKFRKKMDEAVYKAYDECFLNYYRRILKNK